MKEQRLSGFIQSALVCACLAITPAIKKIPKSVLWGYFAYMAVESLPGSEFWDRILLLFTDPKKRYAMLETAHSPYLETVPFGIIVKFTLFQFAYMLIVYGITWAGVRIMAQHCMCCFSVAHFHFHLICSGLCLALVAFVLNEALGTRYSGQQQRVFYVPCGIAVHFCIEACLFFLMLSSLSLIINDISMPHCYVHCRLQVSSSLWPSCS